jgi:hypothetical protein
MSDFKDKITSSTPKPRLAEVSSDPHGPGTLRVEYTLTLEDALTFSRYHWKHWGKRPGQPAHVSWWVPIILGLWGFAGLAKYLGDPASFPNSLVDLICLLLSLFFASVPCFWVFTLLFGGMIRDYRLRRQFRSNPRYSDRRVIAISEEGVTEGDQTATMTIRWHAVVRIIEDGHLAYIYINASEAFVLPKRAFADGRQFEEFVDAARRYHAEARRFVRLEGQA